METERLTLSGSLDREDLKEKFTEEDRTKVPAMNKKENNKKPFPVGILKATKKGMQIDLWLLTVRKTRVPLALVKTVKTINKSHALHGQIHDAVESTLKWLEEKQQVQLREGLEASRGESQALSTATFNDLLDSSTMF